ncbi:MAG: hypothetical protein ACR2JM_01920 [Mycobacterium sp.]
MRIRVSTTAVAVLIAALAGAGPAVADPDTPTPPPPGPAEAPVPVETPPPADAHAAGAPPAPGPAAMDHDGTFTVGAQILPGVYTSAGPIPGGTCYWRRIGADDTTLGNALTKQPQTVQVDASDVAFKTRGCQPWSLTDAPPPGESPPWLSQLQLRHNLDILNGLAGQSGNGQLPPY